MPRYQFLRLSNADVIEVADFVNQRRTHRTPRVSVVFRDPETGRKRTLRFSVLASIGGGRVELLAVSNRIFVSWDGPSPFVHRPETDRYVRLNGDDLAPYLWDATWAGVPPADEADDDRQARAIETPTMGVPERAARVGDPADQLQGVSLTDGARSLGVWVATQPGLRGQAVVFDRVVREAQFWAATRPGGLRGLRVWTWATKRDQTNSFSGGKYDGPDILKLAPAYVPRA